MPDVDDELTFVDQVPGSETKNEPAPQDDLDPGTAGVVFSDEAPSAEDPQPKPAWPLPKTLRAEEPSTSVELAEHAADYAPPEGGEPKVQKEPALEIVRRVAKPFAEPKVRDAGYAMCPECEAKNSTEALLCGRCGTEIPQAIPGAPIDVHADVRRAPLGPIDADLLPDSVKQELSRRRAAGEQRVAAARGRRRWRRRSVALVSAGAYLCCGAFLSGSFYLLLHQPPGLAGGFLLATAIGAGLGGAAGYLTASSGGRMQGVRNYGIAGFVTIALIMAWGGLQLFEGKYGTMHQAYLAGSFFAVPVSLMLLSMVSGSVVGLMAELQMADEV